MKVLVGRKYEEEFKNAFLLISECMALEECSVQGSLKSKTAEIVYGGMTYRYDEAIENAQFAGEEAINGQEQGFTAFGATWFSELRGEGLVNSADALWIKVITEISSLYHRKFSMLTYRPKDGEGADVTKEKAEEIAKNFLNAFHPDFYAEEETEYRPKVRVTEAKNCLVDEEIQDIYGVSLRLALNCGGQSEYVIGKIYFQKYASGMKPLSRYEALDMDNILQSFHTAEESVGRKNVEITRVEKDSNLSGSDSIAKENALTALEDCINDSVAGRDNFLNYLLMDAQTEMNKDREIIGRLLSRTDNSNHELQCDEVKVLYISHLQWKSKIFDAYINGEKALRFVFGLNNRFSLKCLTCKNEPSVQERFGEVLLVYNNEVILKQEEVGDVKSVSLIDATQDAFGVSEEEMQLIRSRGLINDHIKVRKCALSVNRSKKICSCVRCQSQLIPVYYDAQGKVTSDSKNADKQDWLCKLCQRPEKVYYKPLEDESVVTATLALDVNTWTLTKIDDTTKICSCCGRRYKQKEKESKCELCSTAEKLAIKGKPAKGVEITQEDKRAKALYKEYASVLPVLLRVFSCSKAKYCVEDDGLMIFIVGKKLYRFNKLDVGKTGIVCSAKKVK